MFGLGGISGGTLVNTVGGQLNFGKDLNGNPVTTYAQWQAAVAQLRTPTGRSYTNAGGLVNPALYSQIEATLATTDTSAPSEEIDGNVNSTLAMLASIGIVPLVVTQVSCASFDFTTDSPTVPAYWGERWELYKHQYAISRFTWTRGVRKIECASALRVLCARQCLTARATQSGTSRT